MFKYFESSKFWVPKYYASETREGEKCVYSAWFLIVPSGFSCRNRKQLTGRGKGHWWQRWEDAVGCSTVSWVCAGVFNIDCCPLSWTEPKAAESTLCWSASCCVFPAHHMQAGPCEGVCAMCYSHTCQYRHSPKLHMEDWDCGEWMRTERMKVCGFIYRLYLAVALFHWLYLIHYHQRTSLSWSQFSVNE